MEIMRGMESESIDLVYLDPPFNSNHDYAAPIGSKAAGSAFKDTWTLRDVDEAWWGEIAETRDALYAVLGAAGSVGGDSSKSYLIYMAIRLLEMHRVLKATGSLVLHCDPTMSHYLKLILDSIFGPRNFKNEIIWKRSASAQHGNQFAPKKLGSIHDVLLFYAKDQKRCLLSIPKMPVDAADMRRKFPREDQHGPYCVVPAFRAPSTGPRPNLCFTWRGVTNPHPSGWRLNKNKLEEEYQKGNIEIKSSSVVVRKTRQASYKGENMGDIWLDVSNVGGNEKLGYPTQKPLMLLKRIISMTTEEGHTILDPFCGCATACSAAEKLDRKWVGIDISAKAYDLVLDRLRREAGMDKFTKGAGIVIHRTDIPKRAGVRSKGIKHVLFGKQMGKCTGCCTTFEFRHLEVDHIVPKAKGGQDDDSNLQLLCSHCNRVKGGKLTMAEHRIRLEEMYGRSPCP